MSCAIDFAILVARQGGWLFLLSHAVSFERDAMGVVDDPVENGVGDRRPVRRSMEPGGRVSRTDRRNDRPTAAGDPPGHAPQVRTHKTVTLALPAWIPSSPSVSQITGENEPAPKSRFKRRFSTVSAHSGLSHPLIVRCGQFAILSTHFD